MFHNINFVLIASDVDIKITKLDGTVIRRIYGSILTNESGTFVHVRGHELDLFSTRDRLCRGPIFQAVLKREGSKYTSEGKDRDPDYDKVLSTNNISLEITEYSRKNLE